MLIGLQVQFDARSSLTHLDRLYLIVSLARAGPANALVCRRTSPACVHYHFFGNDKRRIEADTKLTDQLRVLLLIAGQRTEKVGSA